LERHRRVNLAPLMRKGFTVTAHSLAIHGLCQKCGQTQPKKSRTRRVPRVSNGQVERMTVGPQKGEEVWGVDRRQRKL
jgi:hypothetical protein